ncbi:MAG TPA: hypothetical protein VI356_24090 [Myxococcales bacterium]
MTHKTWFVSLFAALAIALPAAAQEVTNLPDGARQSVRFDLGLQSALVYRASYSRQIGSGMLYGRFTLPAAGLDFRDFAVEAGGQATALASGDWKLNVAFAPVLRMTDNNLFSATALGVRGTVLPGYQSSRWGLMAELGYEKILATRLKHSAKYRSAGYALAKDGWYSLSGGTLQAGLRGGYRFGRVELSAAAGVLASEGLNAVVPPFYGTLGTAYAF